MGLVTFLILSAFTIITAISVVFAKNAMYSVLSLIACFFTIAGHYLMLNAEFLAIVHIIVYAGAIMVLFLFVVMLLNLNTDNEIQKSLKLKFAGVISGGLIYLILLASTQSALPSIYELPERTSIGSVQEIGMKLFNEYMLPFQISSILFLSAMVGALLLAKK
ncbi:MAG: NADH-quinone oxidoreductase subunit J [Cyclobacteriaceae bacterium]|nr:NADH-quinone oxidoreductase subunit J [Cyclobacteriaceae bacterium]MCH8515260.1 NADH-quinone oxidoreductase subunit J [Cyclobacteriaceae bacterium]